MSRDYCSHCRRVTEHIKGFKIEICKKCGRKQKRFNCSTILIDSMIGKSKHEQKEN